MTHLLVSFLVSYLQCINILSRYPPFFLRTLPCLQVRPSQCQSNSESFSWGPLSAPLPLLLPASDTASPMGTSLIYTEDTFRKKNQTDPPSHRQSFAVPNSSRACSHRTKVSVMVFMQNDQCSGVFPNLSFRAASCNHFHFLEVPALEHDHFFSVESWKSCHEWKINEFFYPGCCFSVIYWELGWDLPDIHKVRVAHPLFALHCETTWSHRMSDPAHMRSPLPRVLH